MEVSGKYLGIWVTSDELEEIFGLHPAIGATVFLLGGEVVGEMPELGLWVRLDTVSVGGGPLDLFPDLAKERPRRLIRWEYIHAAELFEDRTELERVVGFRPHAA
ncbi:MAG: hypothetical protein AUH30_12090 [Candidatus Rokubacteria bacterium 13_1_40CM_68_15]|nr:MAG: hypothetical protein AUH30_12090 [Candidatus Rokubacteria bacterium 13_1_40CM_68_15]